MEDLTFSEEIFDRLCTSSALQRILITKQWRKHRQRHVEACAIRPSGSAFEV